MEKRKNSNKGRGGTYSHHLNVFKMFRCKDSSYFSLSDNYVNKMPQWKYYDMLERNPLTIAFLYCNQCFDNNDTVGKEKRAQSVLT